VFQPKKENQPEKPAEKKKGKTIRSSTNKTAVFFQIINDRDLFFFRSSTNKKQSDLFFFFFFQISSSSSSSRSLLLPQLSF
jgi:hypothetical protein